jgi:hypothetical protein
MNHEGTKNTKEEEEEGREEKLKKFISKAGGYFVN